MESKFRITELDNGYQAVDIITKALNQIGLTIHDNDDGTHTITDNYTPPPPTPDYEYELFFKSEPTDSIKIDGWMPIATERIMRPEKIEEYIKNGLLRRVQKKSPEN